MQLKAPESRKWGRKSLQSTVLLKILARYGAVEFAFASGIHAVAKRETSACTEHASTALIGAPLDDGDLCLAGAPLAHGTQRRFENVDGIGAYEC